MINAINGLRTGFSGNISKNNVKNVVNNNTNYTQISKNASNAISSNAMSLISFKGQSATIDYMQKIGQIANIEVESAKKEAMYIMQNQASDFVQQASLKYSYVNDFLLNMAKQRNYEDFLYPNGVPYIHFEKISPDKNEDIASIFVYQNDGRAMTQALFEDGKLSKIIDYTNHLTSGKVDVFSYEDGKLVSLAKGCKVIKEHGETLGAIDEEFLFDKNEKMVQYSSDIKTNAKGKVFVGKLIEYSGENLVRFQSNVALGGAMGEQSGRLLLFDDSSVIYHQGWRTGADGSISQGRIITFSNGEMVEFEEGYNKNHLGQEFFGKMFEFSNGKVIGYSSDYTTEPSGARSKIVNINIKKGVPNNLLQSLGVM